MSTWWRHATLPVVSTALVASVLGIQLAHGGGTFEPMRLPDSCVERRVSSVSEGITGLAEQLVLRGVNDAACLLGVSREELTLELARGSRSEAQIAALRQGLLTGVSQMKTDGSLPPISDLLDEALASADLPGWVEALIRRLPDSLVDRALPTDEVLTRAIKDLDLTELLRSMDHPDELTALVEPAITQAVKDSLKQRLRDLV